MTTVKTVQRMKLVKVDEDEIDAKIFETEEEL